MLGLGLCSGFAIDVESIKGCALSCNRLLSYIRISGSQLDTRGETKLWLARHLEVIRRFTVDDLRVVKVSAAATFNSASV